MSLFKVYQYFKEGGKLKPGASLYKHLSRKAISLGEGLGYLRHRRPSDRLDEAAEELEVDENTIIDFIRSFTHPNRYRENLNDQGYEDVDSFF